MWKNSRKDAPRPFRTAPAGGLTGLQRLRAEPLRSDAVLLSIPILVILFTYFGSNDFFRRRIAAPGGYSDLNGFVYQHLGCFLVLGCGSILLGALLGFTPRRLGLGGGDGRFGLLFCGLVIPLAVVPLTYFGSGAPGIAAAYPEAKAALGGPGAFALHAAFYALYYVGWEVFFRGYALFGLAERFGAWAAIVIQTIPSALIHTSIVAPGKPFAETLGAVPFGILLGWLAVRTRSVWYGFAIHAAVGLLTDFWLFLRA